MLLLQILYATVMAQIVKSGLCSNPVHACQGQHIGDQIVWLKKIREGQFPSPLAFEVGGI